MIAPVGSLVRQIWNVALYAIEPKGADSGKHTIQTGRQIKAVVLFGRVFQVLRKPIPKRQGIRPAHHAFSKSLRIPERKIEPNHNAAALGNMYPDHL